MKRTLIACLIFSGILTLTIVAQNSTAQKSNPAEALLGAAIHQEEAEGNLEAAIASYKKFLSQYGNNRPLAAKAQYHLGLAYEKLGDKEARKAYERVISDYADQADLAADARRRLAGFDRPAPSDGLTARQVFINSGSFDGFWVTITPDGRIQAGTNWLNGDLLIRDMATGEFKRLLAGSLDPRLRFDAPGRYATWPVFSPNLRELAFSWYGDPQNPNQGQLWVMPSEPGGKPSLVTRNPEFRNVIPSAFSADSKSILVRIERVDRTSHQLAWVSKADGSVKVVKSFAWERNPDYRLSLSPDGRYIAYSARTREGSQDTSIYILAADGSREIELIKTAGINEQPVWTPDGARLLFVSNRAGSFDLWAVALHDGKADGPPALVKRNIGKINSNGMTRSGSYYYTGRQDGVERISIVEMEPGGGKIQGPTVHLMEKLVGAGPSWSPDGKFIAFQTLRTGGDSYDRVVH